MFPAFARVLASYICVCCVALMKKKHRRKHTLTLLVIRSVRRHRALQLVLAGTEIDIHYSLFVMPCHLKLIFLRFVGSRKLSIKGDVLAYFFTEEKMSFPVVVRNISLKAAFSSSLDKNSYRSETRTTKKIQRSISSACGKIDRSSVRVTPPPPPLHRPLALSKPLSPPPPLSPFTVLRRPSLHTQHAASWQAAVKETPKKEQKTVLENANEK